MDGMTVPVVPGREVLVPAGTACAMCRTAGGPLVMVVVGHADTAVCVDSLACVERAVSP